MKNNYDIDDYQNDEGIEIPITGKEFGEDTDWDTEYNPDYGSDD